MRLLLTSSSSFLMCRIWCLTVSLGQPKKKLEDYKNKSLLRRYLSRSYAPDSGAVTVDERIFAALRVYSTKRKGQKWSLDHFYYEKVLELVREMLRGSMTLERLQKEWTQISLAGRSYVIKRRKASKTVEVDDAKHCELIKGDQNEGPYRF